MRTVVSSGNDALNILFEAAAVHSQENSSNRSETQSRNTQTSTAQASNVDHSGDHAQTMFAAEAIAKAKRPVKLSPVSKEVLGVWETCRFVKMGWFTSREAVTLIDQLVQICRRAFENYLQCQVFQEYDTAIPDLNKLLCGPQ